MRIIVIFILWSSVVFTVRAQALKLEKQKYCGFDSEGYYFFQYGSKEVEPGIIRYVLSRDSYFVNPKSLDWDRDNGALLFKNKDIEIYNGGVSKQLTFFINNKKLKFQTEPINDFSVASFPNSDTLFISVNDEAPLYVFDKKTIKLSAIPLTGGNLRVRADYLFFQTPRISDYYSSFPKDLFRVKRNDLKNPEKIIIQVADLWFPYNENVVYAVTDPRIRLCSEKKCDGAFYNLLKGEVEPAEMIQTNKIVEIGVGYYMIELNKEKDVRFRLTDIRGLPSVFNFRMEEDASQIPRGNLEKHYNIPLKEKELVNTFISFNLLYISPESELLKLDKPQLRLLRNTFYAFQGYNFESGDLIRFYSQFEWYIKMSNLNGKDDDPLIWADERERVNLIQKIEDQK